MSTHRESGTIEGPFPTEDPVERLLGFYLTNGYRVVERQHAPEDTPLAVADGEVEAHQPLASATLERGRPGAGWWSSNMTELHTHLTIERNAERIRLSYRIDTTGQLLKDEEEAFWRRELQWATRFVGDESEKARDLRDEEARRAKHQTSDIRSFGVWTAVAIFLAIVALGFFGII